MFKKLESNKETVLAVLRSIVYRSEEGGGKKKKKFNDMTTNNL